MKNKLLFLLGLMLACSNIAHAANTLKVQDVQVAPGGSVSLNIELNNTSTNLMGWQCDIVLPNGLSLALKSNGKPAATLGSRFSTTEHSISTNVLSNGSYRFIATSLDGEAIPGSSGAIFSVTIQADASLSQGSTLTGKIQNIELNTQDNQKLTLNDVSFSISIPAVPDIDITRYISAMSAGGAIMQTNNLINSGSQLSWRFSNRSDLNVTLKSMQLIDGRTGTAGNIMTVNKLVESGQTVGYTTTIGLLGIHTPVTCRFRYEYNGVEYSVDAVYKSMYEYTLSIKTMGNGTVTYSSSTMRDDSKSFTVDRYDSATLTFTPDEGYRIKSVKVNNSNVTSSVSNNKYTITSIAGDKNVVVEFEIIPPTHILTVIATGNGSVSYDNNGVRDKTTTFTVEEGVPTTVLITPDNGYGVSIVKDNGVDVSSAIMNGKYEIDNITKDKTISVVFDANKYKLTYMVDDVLYKSYNIKYSSTISPEPAPIKENYVFSGWSEIPQTMPAHDLIVTGTFSAKTYKLTYKIDGKEYKTYDVGFGTLINNEAAPSKEGYTFSGWSSIPKEMPAHDVVVTGAFSKNQYTINYIVDGKLYKSVKFDFGDAVTPEQELAREGYSFSGWDNIPTEMPAHDVNVSGSFSINSYYLTYQVDGQTYKTFSIEYGATITPATDPIKEGYSFSGWISLPERMPAHDVVVMGAFSKNQYTINYIVDGNTYKSVKIYYGDAVTHEEEPSKEGYSFSGWSEFPSVMPASDVTITGTFSINTYHLTYQIDGQAYKSFDMEYGVTITPEDNPTKEGYNFTGWSFIPQNMPAEDVIVSGSFIKNQFTITYELDGQVYKIVTVDYNDYIVPEAEPEKEGCTFLGWSAIPNVMPPHDITVKGSFAIKSYKLVYKIDGEQYAVYDVAYGSAISAEEAPVKEGYTFMGWSWIPKTMPAEDVTIIGAFKVNSYLITYVVDGVIYQTESVDYGSEIIPPVAQQRTGYTFAWDDYPELMPAHAITINGMYEVVSSINSIAKGSVKKEKDYVYFSGLKANEFVIIFSLKGEQLFVYQASDDGELKITLSTLQQGIYIIKTTEKTFKVTKK